MDKRVVVVLAAIAAALVAYVVVFERGSLTSKELNDRKDRALVGFVRDRVDQLILEKGAQRLVLERDNKGEGAFASFRVVSPQPSDADDDAVDSLLGELEWLSARRTIAQPTADDLKRFGLSAPSYILRFRAAGKVSVLRIGKADVHDESYYAKLDDESQVLLVPKTVVEAIDHDVSHFRTKRLFGDITVAWVQKLELSHGGDLRSFAKENGRFWALASPKGWADETGVRTIVEALDGLRAVRYAPADALTSLSVPAGVVRLRVVPDVAREDRSAATFQLSVYGACPGHANERLARSGDKGDPVCIRDEDARRLIEDVGSLREDCVLPVDPSEVEQIELSAGDQKLTVARKEDSWLASAGAAPDREAVEAWLRDLRATRAVAFAAAPASPPGATVVTLGLAGGKRLVLRAGAAQADDTVAMVREGEGLLWTFAGDSAALLMPLANRFRSLEPWLAHKPSEVVGVEARLDAQRPMVARTLTLVDGMFRTGPRKEPVADSLRIRELVRSLLRLHATSFVSDAARTHEGFAAPVASAVVTLANGTRLSLEVGAKLGDTHYVRVDRRDVFRAGDDVLAQLYELAGAPVPVELTKRAQSPGEEPESDEDGAEEALEHAH